ncbi:MAG: hypothetical protein AAF333_08880 [Planctomycetota bacterium]
MQIHSFRFGVGPGIHSGSGPQVPPPPRPARPRTAPLPAQPYNPVINGATAVGRGVQDRIDNSAPVRAGRWVADLPGRVADGLSNWWTGYRNRLAAKFQPRLPEPASAKNLGTHPGISDGEGVRRPKPIGGIGGAFGGPLFAPGQFP